MLRTVFLAALVCACFVTSAAQAKPRHSNLQGNVAGCSDPVMRPCGTVVRKSRTTQRFEKTRRFDQLRENPVIKPARYITGRHHDPRPRAWCGYFARHNLVSRDPGREYNLAAKWAGYGRRAFGPAVGTLVVWRHHIGKIVGRAPHGWIVLSGNDGNAIRKRIRSVSNAIAFRWPS